MSPNSRESQRPPAYEPPREPDMHPVRVGPYHILGLLAEGGMGTVYIAEQVEPVRRRVAVKVVKLGMDTREVVARFQAERQALAVMEHPGIAKVLDGGITDDGRPYFVMELVKGVSITEYCDLNRLNTRDRLALFIEVCHAVQHAHFKGVIHRDLKPSNVLIALQDGMPVPKVIDFGIAKALSTPLTNRSLFTEVGRAIGSPAYMSPEQADGSSLDVDTRTDVYSLGVMLYQLLVGRLPMDPEEVGMSVYLMRLANRETMPTTPSARLITLGNEVGPVSRDRSSDTQALRRELRGDLDWIVMKALEPDRGRRYETVNALGVDVQRYLRAEPIAARPPSTSYRLSRFVKRNRAAVVAAGVVVAGLMTGLSVAAIGFASARRAEARAVQEAESSRRVADFLTKLFRVSDPSEARGNSVTAREILDRGAERIRGDLAADPVVQAQLMHTMGSVYREMGLFGQAQPLLEQALSLQGAHLGPENPERQATMLDLGRVAQQQGRFAVAESLYRGVEAAQQRMFGRDDPRLAVSLSALGGMYVTRGRTVDAESLLVRAVALRDRSRTPEDADYARTLRYLASAYLAQGRYADAEPLFRRALEMYVRVVGADHPDVGRTFNNLGVVYYGLQRYDDAQQYYLRAEANLSRNLGADHPNVASININLGEIAWRRGQLDDGAGRLLRALDILAKRVEPNHPTVATAEFDLANVRRDQGQYAEAETRYRRALAIREGTQGSVTPGVREVLVDYAKSLRASGRPAEAQRIEARANDPRYRKQSP